MIRPRFVPPHAYARVVCAGFAASALFLGACGNTPAPDAPLATTTTRTNTNPRPGFIATLVPLTEAPAVATRGAGGSATPRIGNAAFPTSTAIRGNSPVGTAAMTGTRTWTDPVNGIQLQYPAVWQATPAATPNDDDLRLDGPGNQTIFVDISAPDANGPAPTTDEALQLIRDAQARSMQYTYTYGMEQDVQVGGEPARYLEYRYTPRANQTAPPAQGAIWVVQRGDRTYVLRASNIGGGRADVDTIIGSVSYSVPATITSSVVPTVRSTAMPSGAASATPRPAGPTATAALVRGTPSSVASRAPSTSSASSAPAAPPTATP